MSCLLLALNKMFTPFIPLAYLSFLLTTVLAGTPDTYPGFRMIWSETFPGKRLNTSNWEYYLASQPNGEQETYTNSRTNCRVGSGVLAIEPQNTNGEWTSCRIQTLSSFTAPKGGQLIVQSKFKLGRAGANLQGIWPAFWALGETFRTGEAAWPYCGEIDTFENVNANKYGYSALHCGESCNEPSGLSSGIAFSYGDYHTWSHKIDLTSSDYAKQSITWYMDGNQYHVVYGSQSGNETVWQNVARSAMFLVLNVAIGSGWPGDAVAGTATGKAGGMQVDYVAVYQST